MRVREYTEISSQPSVVAILFLCLDAEIARVVEANQNEYRNNGSIQPKLAENDKEYFPIEYGIVLKVDGRNLKAKLFYPPGQECGDELKICISTWFRAGTK